MNLKRELDQALKNLALRETEYKALQKTTKVTKFKELDVTTILCDIFRKNAKLIFKNALDYRSQ